MSGVDLIAAERSRQRLPVKDGGEGYEWEHDQGQGDELALAAACYAIPAEFRPHADRLAQPDFWPWAGASWKPTPNDRVRELVKAGALLAAAIDAELAR